MSAVYVWVFHVLLCFVAVGNKVLMVALQIIALNGLGARDAVEVLQQEFCHGDTLGETFEQVAAECYSASHEIIVRSRGSGVVAYNAGVELLPGFEEVGKAFRSCEGALHRLYSSMFLVFLARYFY